MPPGYIDYSAWFSYKMLLTYQDQNQLGENDNVIYNAMLRKDGTVALTANWDAGGYEIRSQTFQSDTATGTAPFIVASTTVTTNLNADTVDGVHATTFATFNYSGAKVFDNNAPAAWTDLDLSGTVGTARVLVLLKVKGDDVGGNDTYRFREDDEAGDVPAAALGVSVIALLAQNEVAYIWIMTDATGIIEWISSNQRNTEIYVLAYMKGG